MARVHIEYTLVDRINKGYRRIGSCKHCWARRGSWRATGGGSHRALYLGLTLSPL